MVKINWGIIFKVLNKFKKKVKIKNARKKKSFKPKLEKL